ncbi:MAG: cyclic nucleotide-binding domain-containing protein [Calditrichia bacterium]
MKNPQSSGAEQSSSASFSNTQLMRTQQHSDRWSDYQGNDNIIKFSRRLSVKQLRTLELFNDYSDEFLTEISPDISIAQWMSGTVLFEEGSYIDLMFFVINGIAEATLSILAPENERPNRPIFATRLQENPSAEERVVTSQTVLHQKIASMEARPDVTMLSAVDFQLNDSDAFKLGKGDMFGEIGALNGWPQSVTVRTISDCLLCQIRLPALRKMKDHSETFKQKTDTVYRDRFLYSQLKATPLLRDCSPALINHLKDKAELISVSPGKPVVLEGEAVDAFYLLRSGNIKLTQRVGSGEATVNYLSKGMTIGAVELLIEDIENWAWSATSVAYSELIKISLADFTLITQHHPQIERRLWRSAVRTIKESGCSRKNLEQSELIQFSLERGLVEGNSMLLIDLETCVRCDDCVRGCAAVHDGRPKFVREGEKYENYLIARSCYHCEDPVCLIGCPTGAIRRANVDEIVEINEKLCIGCSNCANKCPYDAIVMHETGESWSDDALPEHLRGKERKVASKCDLCFKTNNEPACVANCAQGSAIRIKNITDFQALMERKNA